MANNYLQFSEQLYHLTPEEVAWFKDVLEHPDPDEEWDGSQWRTWFKKWGVPAAETGEYDYWPDFTWKISTGEDGETDIWFYAEESGNVDNLALVVKAFLKKFRPTEYFTLTWAVTCSRMRIGEFSGGGVFVSANKIKWSTPEMMIDKEAEAHRKKYPPKKGKKR